MSGPRERGPMQLSPSEPAQATNQGDTRSVANLAERVRKQMRNLGPRNASRLLLEECLVALTALAYQLHEQKQLVNIAAGEIARQRQRTALERPHTCDEIFRRLRLLDQDPIALEAIDAIVTAVLNTPSILNPTPAAQETSTDGETPVAHV